MTTANRDPAWGGSGGGSPSAIPPVYSLDDFAVAGDLLVRGGDPHYDARAFGAIGDGVTNNAPMLTDLITVANSTSGARIYIPSGIYMVNSALPQITAPVIIEGTGAGIVPATLGSTVLKFAAGVKGLDLSAAAQYSAVRDLYLQSLSAAATADHGIQSIAHATEISGVVVDGFGGDGIHIDTTSGGNANNSEIRRVRTTNCKGNGFFFKGIDSNVIGVTQCDASFNGGWGYRTEGSSCLHLNCHADGNTLGGFYNNGNSNVYLLPYVEPGTGYNVTFAASSGNGVWITGSFTDPPITNNGGNNFIIHNAAIDQLFVGTTDCLISRAAANVILTPDQFRATDGVATRTKAGAITDSDFAVTPINGMLAVDTTNFKLYFRVGANVWKSVTGT